MSDDMSDRTGPDPASRPDRYGPRVVVGVDGSLASMAALRQAVEEARARRASLYAVTVALDDPYYAAVGRVDPHQDEIVALVRDRLTTVFGDAMGSVPEDVDIHLELAFGPPGPALVDFARPDDLLVVGSSGRASVRRWLHRSVPEYCTRHARCPVLTVPLSPFARSMRRAHRWRRRKDLDRLLRA